MSGGMGWKLDFPTDTWENMRFESASNSHGSVLRPFCHWALHPTDAKLFRNRLLTIQKKHVAQLQGINTSHDSPDSHDTWVCLKIVYP